MESTENIVDFDELVGGEFDFYGVDNTCFRLDDTVYEFIDDDEFYRIVETPQEISGLPIARVTVDQVAHSIYAIMDLHDDHCWLSFGETEADYCTTTFFDYTPKALASND